jgi:NAD(P)H-dependent FMN reductase
MRPPASVLELKKRIRRADALLIVTPEYNYSISGVLKNALDWACRPYPDAVSEMLHRDPPARWFGAIQCPNERNPIFFMQSNSSGSG